MVAVAGDGGDVGRIAFAAPVQFEAEGFAVEADGGGDIGDWEDGDGVFDLVVLFVKGEIGGGGWHGDFFWEL